MDGIKRFIKSFFTPDRRAERSDPGVSTAPSSGVQGGGLLAFAKTAEEELSKVIVPGYDIDLVSSGIVKRLRVSRDGKKIAVFIDYTGSDPGCYYCKFINWSLWKRILSDAESRLKSRGFEETIFVDWATGAVIEYKEK